MLYCDRMERWGSVSWNIVASGGEGGVVDENVSEIWIEEEKSCKD